MARLAYVLGRLRQGTATKVTKALAPIEVISAVTGQPQWRRIVILRRDDGCFSFAE